jgi:predicted NBD/HSP70 family sugar kinase
MNSILFDIGATKIRMAYSVDGEIFEEPKVFETPKNYEEGLKLFVETAKKLAKEREIKKIVGGMSRSVLGWPNDYEKFKQDLGERLGAEIFIENDAAMVGLGEANWGAGRGFEIVAYITVSTGVGGARIVSGKIDERAIGFEPGKQIIDVDTKKTLEEMISGKALAEKTGKHPKEITDENIWDEHAKILAVGLNNIIVEWSPNCVVLGGSMITGNPSISVEKTEQYLKEILKIFPQLPAIRKAELGDFGGLYGALAYLKNPK